MKRFLLSAIFVFALMLGANAQQTKDNKQFRYVYVDFEQKRNLFTFKNNILHFKLLYLL